MNHPRVVAIDGAAGAGKSTLARALAGALGLPYINTGLMYRALARAALREGVSAGDETGLVALMPGLRFTVHPRPPRELEVEGYVEGELITLEVEATVSAVARHPLVRGAMRLRQRELGEPDGAVMEGRDIGSVVFPDAPVKLYLVADPDTRAGRRRDERLGGDPTVAEALHQRDSLDARVNPFEPPAGAVVIDTARLGVEETFEAALTVIRRHAPELLP